MAGTLVPCSFAVVAGHAQALQFVLAERIPIGPWHNMIDGVRRRHATGLKAKSAQRLGHQLVGRRRSAQRPVL
jgi:hypothetical protein